MSGLFQIVKDLKDTLAQDGRKTAPYDTPALVTRIEGGTAWVEFAGSEAETPIQMTVNAEVGDTVQVRVSGGTAWIVGNNTAPPTDDRTAIYARTIAVGAQETAEDAQQTAGRAQQYADEAQASAVVANSAANSALTQLSVVEDVAGTLAWIQEHGSYVPSEDTSVQDGTIYFEKVGNDYVPIANPDADANPSERGWYVLDVSSSQSEYIMAHLAVTSAGLWVLPSGAWTAHGLTDSQGNQLVDSQGNSIVDWRVDPQNASGYKVLLSATGMAVFDETGTAVAVYGATTTIGNALLKHVYIDSDSVDIMDGDTVLATFGSTTRIGQPSNKRVELSTNGVDIYNSSNQKKASYGSTQYIYGGNGTYPLVETSGSGVKIAQSENNYTDVTDDGMDVQFGGQSVASFGSYARIGKQSEMHLEQDASGITFSDGTYTPVVITQQYDSSSGYTGIINLDNDEICIVGTHGDKDGNINIDSLSLSSYGTNNNRHAEVSMEAYGRGDKDSSIRCYDDQVYVTAHAVTVDNGNVYVQSANNVQRTAGYYATNEDTGITVSLMVGSAGYNHGVYSDISQQYIIYDDGGGTVRIPSEDVRIKGHASSIGATITEELSSTVSLASGTAKAVLSVTLSAGTWVLVGKVRFPSNATGYRVLNFSTTSGAPDVHVRVPAVSGNATDIQETRILNLSADSTKYYLNALQNSGSALSVTTANIQVVRIA